MKKRITVLFGAALLCASPALSAVDFDLNLHLGSREPAPIIVSEPPLFLESVSLGLQVAVETPYEMFLLDGRYFLFRDGGWWVAPGFGGPWSAIRRDHLPPGLAKRSHRDLVVAREAEYDRFRKGHYRGKTYRPDREEHGRGRGHDKKKH